VGSLDIFRAIRDQGRDRLVDLFQWRVGTLAYYSGQTAPHVEFPLDLELPPLILAGMGAAQPGDTPVRRWRDLLDATLAPGDAQAQSLRAAPWPIAARRSLDAVDRPLAVRTLIATLTRDPATGGADEILRAVEVLLLARLLTLSTS
jgi:hypothetical protein